MASGQSIQFATSRQRLRQRQRTLMQTVLQICGLRFSKARIPEDPDGL